MSLGVRAKAAVPVEIDCAVLGEERRAALEARVRAALLQEADADARVWIACDDGIAELRVTEADAVRTRRRPLGASSEDAVDGLLDELERLISSGHPAATPPATARATSVLTSGSPTRDDRLPEPDRAPADRTRHALSGELGADAELWSGDIPLAAGGHAGLRVAFGNLGSLLLEGGPAWGTNAASSVRATLVRGSVDFLVPLASRFAMGFGAGGRSLWADASGNVTPAHQGGATIGLRLSARWGVGVGPIELALAPSLELLARPLAVEVAKAEVFRIPRFVAGLALDVSFPD